MIDSWSATTPQLLLFAHQGKYIPFRYSPNIASSTRINSYLASYYIIPDIRSLPGFFFQHIFPNKRCGPALSKPLGTSPP